MTNFVTIYTDASVCPRKHCGGWACWIKFSEGEVLKAHGAFRSEIKDSTVAELQAIANALVVVEKNIAPRNAILVIVTDSSEAISAIKGRPFKYMNKLYRQQALGVADAIKTLVPTTCQMRMKKVKAHSDKDGRRSFVNNLVDAQARSKMQEARKTS